MNAKINHEYTKEYKTERIRKKGCRWPSSLLPNFWQPNKLRTNSSCHALCQAHGNEEDCHIWTNQQCSTWNLKARARLPSKDMITIIYKKFEGQIYSLMAMEHPINASKMGVRFLPKRNDGREAKFWPFDWVDSAKGQRLDGSDGWCCCLSPT